MFPIKIIGLDLYTKYNLYKPLGIDYKKYYPKAIRIH